MSDPLVSFVVPCYNYGRFLDDCLHGIFVQQGCENFEIIAIDDASTDNTREILASYRDPRLRVILHEKNRGHIDSVNEGAAVAGGSFITRIDPDDRYRPGFLSATLAKFREHPRVGLVYGDASVIDDGGAITEASTDRVHGGADFKGNEFVALLKENFICAPTTIARREAWEQVLPIPAGLAFNDWYLNIMIARRWECYYINRILADYRVHGSNHHIKVSRDKTEEASILRLLDLVYSQTEDSKELEKAKRKARRAVYGAQYLTLAEKYFWFHMNEDAARCYGKAVKNRPGYLLRPGVMRRFAASVAGREWYEEAKAILKGRAI